MRLIDSPWPRMPLHGTHSSRRIEAAALDHREGFSLMARAGLSVARWALALHPHAQRLWVVAGPGNNGGDGLVAATWWHRLGRTVHVSLLADPARLPPDARQALAEALSAGVPVSDQLDARGADLALDALLGLGQRDDGPRGRVLDGVQALQGFEGPVLAIDLPTGLCADTGRVAGAVVQADATLALLTLKPGLFTAQGRDAAGSLWWDSLGCEAEQAATGPDALLIGHEELVEAVAPRAHQSHKGRFGDCWVVGGAAGMHGAAVLAGHAALQAGAGRVYLSMLDPGAATDGTPAELMHRAASALQPAMLQHATVVCGCGGGDAVRAVLPVLLSHAARLVLDADALNAVAADTNLARLLQARGRRDRPSLLTPHPLEAARLLGTTVSAVQADRCASALALAERYGAVVVLKGSGTIVARPGGLPGINPSGDGRLATAGTGDVLAGWLGGAWSAQGHADQPALWRLACGVTHLHGAATRQAPRSAGPLTASALIEAMARTATA